jgi:hypothetical protein
VGWGGARAPPKRAGAGGGGARKKKLFTFSRRVGKSASSSGYASGGMLPGGDDPPPPGVGRTAAGGRGRRSSPGTRNAAIVRRTAQRLELLSIVDDEMALPRYSAPASARSPRRPKAGGGGHAGGTTGGGPSAPAVRFGRTPAPSDLSGFEYRPPSSLRQQHHHHRATALHGGGGASVSGTTASASTTGGSPDDASVGSGGDDATAATVSSRYTTSSSSTSSSVPTLSKSTRDSSPIASSWKSSRSRFLQRKRTAKGEGGATTPMPTPTPRATTFKPPLFTPRPRPNPQPAYDPFSMDDDFDDYEEDDTVAAIPGEARSVSSASSPTRDNEWAQTTPVDQTPMTPDHQTPTAPGDLSSGTPNAPEGDDAISQSSLSPPETPQDFGYSSPAQVTEAFSPSMSEEEEKSANVLQSISESAPSSPREEPPTEMELARDTVVGLAADETEETFVALEPIRYLDVGLALNEDLTCEYHLSKLSSLSVDGTVQVSVKTRYKQEPSQHQMQQPTAPFSLIFTDHSGHIKALQENKKFVEHVTQGDIANREFAYTIRVPREDEYFPVVRYKCGTSLRPVPIVSPNPHVSPIEMSLSINSHIPIDDSSAFIQRTQRVQTRVKSQGKFCRIALQISSNPQNPGDLVNLTIIMSVPNGVRGDSLICNPPGGVWNDAKRVVLWCVSELGCGEKFQLQSIFELTDESLNGNDLEFPVLARCQCTGGQLSDVALEVSEVPNAYPAPAEVSKSIARRFRVSHKESNK